MNLINEENANRDITIDCVKALAIIMMVMGHARMPQYSFVYLFHMALFFMASGYMYRTSKITDISSVLRYALKKIKTIWLCYFIWNSFFSICHNLFIKLNIYTNNKEIFTYVFGNYVGVTEYWTIKMVCINIIKSVFFQGGTEMGGAFWFLQALFLVTICYTFFEYIIKLINEKNVIVLQTVISIIFLVIGFVFGKKGISLYGLPRFLSCYFIFQLGRLIKEYGTDWLLKTKPIYVCVPSFALLILLYKFVGPVSIANNEYVNPFYLLCTSLLGWYFTYTLSILACKNKTIRSVLLIIGQNTMAIVIWHFMSFKIVNYVYVRAMGWPLCCIAAFPVITEKGMWWIAYLFVGILIPVLISIGYKYVVKRVRFISFFDKNKR